MPKCPESSGPPRKLLRLVKLLDPVAELDLREHFNHMGLQTSKHNRPPS
jgi:hypothetical protein